MTLVTDFPRLWHDPATPQRERKRMVRLLLEDVTLLKADEVVAQIRFRGGATHTLRLPLPRSAPELRKTHSTVVAEIDRLIDTHTDVEIAEILNARSLRPGVADRFSTIIISHIRQHTPSKTRLTRLPNKAFPTPRELTAASAFNPGTVRKRAPRG